MKKAVTFLSFVICFLLIAKFNNVSATSATIPADLANYGDIIGLQDLGFALIGGAQFEFDSSKYVIEDYSSLSAAGKLEAERQKIKEFLADYEASRGIQYGYTEGALYQGQPYYTTAFTNNASQKLEEYALSSGNVDWAIGISPYKFADWATYNRFWIDKYVDSFEASGSDSPIVNPDTNYSTYINFINNRSTNHELQSFWFYDMNTTYTYGRYTYTNNFIPWTSYSYYVPYNYSANFNHNSYDVTFISTNIISIYIYSTQNENEYSYNVSFAQNPSLISRYKDQTLQQEFNACNITQLNVFQGQDVSWNLTDSYTGTLEQIFNRLICSYKNINIYVDGDPWSIVGNPAPANPVIPSFPDIIQNDQDLAYDIPFPKTDNYSGTFDLTSVLDAIGKAISGASDNDSTTSSVLTGEDVVDTYDGTDIDTLDKVAEVESTKVFAGTLEDTTTDRLPDIPVPPIGVHNGLAGATVLAKYIDATQCILPEELITVFWGGFFILIILGLIKSLHR